MPKYPFFVGICTNRANFCTDSFVMFHAVGHPDTEEDAIGYLSGPFNQLEQYFHTLPNKGVVLYGAPNLASLPKVNTFFLRYPHTMFVWDGGAWERIPSDVER